MVRRVSWGAAVLACVVMGCSSSMDSSNPGGSPPGVGGAGGEGGTRAELGFVEHPCTVDIPEGFTQDDVRCGALTALQDRANPEGPTVTVEFGVVFARQQPAASDPLVYIPGGPGSPAIEDFFALDALGLLKTVNETRDLVYFDPRGTGISTPDLSCPERLARANEAYFAPGRSEEDGAARREGMRACYDRLIASGFDLSHYHSASISADLADGLEALGYESANFWATSYGGRVVQTFMREYPELTRSVVLDAPAMPDIRSTEASDFKRAFDTLLEDCAESPTCSSTYPNLEPELYAVVDSLNENPVPVDVEFEGETVTVYVSGDRFIAGLQNAFNSNSLNALIPLAINSTFNGSFAIVQTVAPDLLSAFDVISWGHFASVDCAENAPFWTEAERTESNQGVDPRIVAAIDPISHGVDVAVCDFWEVEPRPAIAGESVISDIPTLILQGDYDTAIPTSYSERAAQNLSNSQYVLFPTFGHVVLGLDFNPEGTTCGQRIFNQFLNAPTSPVDATCTAEIAIPF